MRALILAFLLPLALAIGGCALTSDKVVVSKTDAQKALAVLQQGRASVLRVETAYLKQTPCGTPGAMQPPLCASYRVGLTMQAYNRAFAKSLMDAEARVESAGDAGAIETAVESARIAFSTWRNFVAANTGKDVQ